MEDLLAKYRQDRRRLLRRTTRWPSARRRPSPTPSAATRSSSAASTARRPPSSRSPRRATTPRAGLNSSDQIGRASFARLMSILAGAAVREGHGHCPRPSSRSTTSQVLFPRERILEHHRAPRVRGAAIIPWRPHMKMLIDSQWTDSADRRTKAVRNPGTGEIIDEVPLADRRRRRPRLEGGRGRQRADAGDARAPALRRIDPRGRGHPSAQRRARHAPGPRERQAHRPDPSRGRGGGAPIQRFRRGSAGGSSAGPFRWTPFPATSAISR